MRGARGAALAALAFAAAAVHAQDPGRPPVVVTLADGTSLPLRAWSLSYEIGSWRDGTSPAFATFAHVDSGDLVLGKKSYPMTGGRLELQYVDEDRQQDVDGETKTVKVPIARGLTFVGPDGKKQSPKLEPPQRDVLLPNPEKGRIYQVRSVDLKGETLTGTQRDICLLSFTALVECGAPKGQQVVKLEFQK